MNGNYDLKTILKFIIIVLIIAIAFYFITILGSKKETSPKTTSEEAIIQYEEIIIGNMFEQKEEEYYVLLKKADDPYISYYETNITNYKSKDDALKVYTVDLSSAFNKKYISDTNNIEKDNFKINSTVLLKIKNKEIVESYENNTEIMNQLKQMTE